MTILNIPIEKAQSLFDNAELSENTLLLYFTDDRDPTPSEPDVTAIGIPAGWCFYWWNTSTKEWFVNRENVEDAMVWAKMVDDMNIASVLAEKEWHINTSRNYFNVSSPDFDVNYQPSVNSDTFVSLVVRLQSILLTAAKVSLQVDSGAGFEEVAFVGMPSGIIETNDFSMSAIVPAGSTYKIVSDTGASNSILLLKELSM